MAEPLPPLELRLCDHAWRWRLTGNCHGELWRGAEYLGSLSGLRICVVLEHYLTGAQLMGAIAQELDAPPARPAAPIPKMRKPPRAIQERRRRQRQERRNP